MNHNTLYERFDNRANKLTLIFFRLTVISLPAAAIVRTAPTVRELASETFLVQIDHRSWSDLSHGISNHAIVLSLSRRAYSLRNAFFSKEVYHHHSKSPLVISIDG